MKAFAWPRLATAALLAALLSPACLLYENGGNPVPAKCGGERTAVDGGPCTCSADCRSESAVCLDEATTGMPRGVCARQCGATPDCEPGFVCMEGYCFAGCMISDDCGAGRACAPTNVDGAANRAACTFLCDEDSDCSSGNCNVYRNMCLPQGRVPSGAGVSAVCGRDSDCKSNACLDGACLTRCDRDNPRCPDDALCIEGLCLAECRNDADCSELGTKLCLSLEADSFCF